MLKGLKPKSVLFNFLPALFAFSGFISNHSDIPRVEVFSTCRTQKICVARACSDWINLYQGVPQETILVPLLSIFVNSMHLHVSEPVKINHCADETFLFAVIEDIEVGIDQFESAIENLLMFSESHQLNLNATKTEFVIFSTKSNNQKNMK